ncbi:ribosome biogenesis protein [Theileria orientalis]|uniref:Ribosome biogenesis protein n=1 Tax=Theileria orientalis TaxID=68886 RepID=A0A976M6S4_THEOR|nr:ribosome biogenesis protein [Theileria orientalis]
MTINFVICNASLELYFGNKKYNQTKLTLLQEHIHNTRSSNDVDSLNDDLDEEPVQINLKRRSSARRDWSEVRPDIVHFCLLAFHDSILNKEGIIQVYVQTLDRKLFKISKDFRVPRTFKVFNKVFANYLHSNSKNLTTESGEVLVELLDQPLESLIPEGSKRIAVDNQCPNCNLSALISDLKPLIDDSWFFISVSPTRPLDSICPSGVVDVSKVHKRILSRDTIKRSPADTNHLEALEHSYLNYKHEIKKSCKYDHCISIKEYNLSCLANCFTLICTLESALDY